MARRTGRNLTWALMAGWLLGCSGTDGISGAPGGKASSTAAANSVSSAATSAPVLELTPLPSRTPGVVGQVDFGPAPSAGGGALSFWTAPPTPTPVPRPSQSSYVFTPIDQGSGSVGPGVSTPPGGGGEAGGNGPPPGGG